MKAAVTTRLGGPIELAEVPDPERRSGEVLVRVAAASVNRLDRLVFERGFGMGTRPEFPLIQGIDAAGVIESGSGSLATGLRVVVKPSIGCRTCRWCRLGRSGDCVNATTFGIHRQGGFAELLSVPRTNLIRLPDSISFASAAAAAHTHAVVLRMIRAAGDLPPDAVVMVTGAGGALGTAAVQLATALGYRVVAVASSNAKLLAARDLGALVGLNHASGDLAADMDITTEGQGVDLVLETTGSAEMITASAAVLGRGGALVMVAAVPGTKLELDALSTYRSRHRIVGSANSHLRDFSDVYRLMDEHHIVPVVSDTLPLERTGDGMELVTDRTRIGKIVIDVEGSG